MVTRLIADRPGLPAECRPPRAPGAMRGTLLASALLASLGAAQQLVWERVGVRDSVVFGGPTAWIGDVDRDGWTDCLHQVTVGANAVELWVLSGRDGGVLRTRSVAGGPGGPLAAAGDMDGDGVGDYAVVNATAIEVCSGRDDRVLWRPTTGPAVPVALLGNLHLDADGRPDLLAFDVLHTSVHVYSNAGALLRVFTGASQLRFWGSGGDLLARAGDVNRDGIDDFVAPCIDSARTVAGPGICSGADGKLLAFGSVPSAQWLTVAGFGDVDRDGIPDFGAANYRPLTDGAGTLHVFSGRTSAAIHAWSSAQVGPGFWGTSAAQAIDVDRDGASDIVVGCPYFRSTPTSKGTVFGFSGRDGSMLWTLTNDTSAPGEPRFGQSIAATPGQPGSAFPWLAVSEPGHAPIANGRLPALGRLRVYSLGLPGGTILGAPCRGTLENAPQIGARGFSGRLTRVSVVRGPASSLALLLVGLSRTRIGTFDLPLPLSRLGYPGCVLFTSAELALPVALGGPGPDAGFATIDLGLRASAAGPLALHLQWLAIGTGSRAPGGLSEALSLRVE